MASISSINPTLIADDAVERLSQESNQTPPFVKTIIDAQSAIEGDRIPEGKSGLVLGSGQNTAAWSQKGWFTLDVNPTDYPHYNVDANYMTASVPKGWDYIYAEAIRMDPKMEKGVNEMQLIDQAGTLLKPGGTLVIKTANFEGNPNSTLPRRDEYIEKILQRGYEVTAEVHTINHFELNGTPASQQKVVYYVTKPKSPQITH